MKNNFKLTESQKSAVFGGIVTAVVLIILVLIVVFAVKGKSDDKAVVEEEKDTVSVTETLPSKVQNEQSTENFEEDITQESTIFSSGSSDDGYSMQYKLDIENKRYKREVDNINEDYDAKINTQKQLLEFSKKASKDRLDAYKSEVERIDSEISMIEENEASYEKLQELRAERDEYQKNVDRIEADYAQYETAIDSYEKSRQQELDSALKTHEKNLSDITG